MAGVPASTAVNYSIVAIPQGYNSGTNFPSLPGSFTALDPGESLPCDDITSDWLVTYADQNVVGYALRQSGNSVSGNLAYVSILTLNGVDLRLWTN